MEAAAGETMGAGESAAAEAVAEVAATDRRRAEGLATEVVRLEIAPAIVAGTARPRAAVERLLRRGVVVAE